MAVSIVFNSSFLTTTAYAPNPVTVPAGATITWTNNDNVDHTSTSQNNIWASPTIGPGASYSRQFNTAGSFPYYCIFHPGMVGTVVVQ